MNLQKTELPLPERQARIAIIEQLPYQLTALIHPLTPDQMNRPAQTGQWSIAQIIHHLADAHMNSYIRTKRILAENGPEQRPFDQENWVDMPDEVETSVENSLMILRAIHHRWVVLFQNLSEADWGKTGLFRSDGSEMTIDYLLNSYANHSQAHLAQIKATLAASPITSKKD